MKEDASWKSANSYTFFPIPKWHHYLRSLFRRSVLFPIQIPENERGLRSVEGPPEMSMMNFFLISQSRIIPSHDVKKLNSSHLFSDRDTRVCPVCGGNWVDRTWPLIQR